MAAMGTLHMPVCGVNWMLSYKIMCAVMIVVNHW